MGSGWADWSGLTVELELWASVVLARLVPGSSMMVAGLEPEASLSEAILGPGSSLVVDKLMMAELENGTSLMVAILLEFSLILARLLLTICLFLVSSIPHSSLVEKCTSSTDSQ